MRCVGYRQVLEYLRGDYDRNELLQRGIFASRQLAKRQLTWLRAELNCEWLFDDADPLEQALRIIAQTLGQPLIHNCCDSK
jgi:tRNA dimethylallyltransferase